MRRPRSGPTFHHSGRPPLPPLLGGLAGLIAPVAALVPAVSALLGGDQGAIDSPDSSVAAAGLFLLVAAPTVWILSLLDLSPVVTLAAAIATSLPLWFLAGAWLATRSRSWFEWVAKSAGLALGWVVALLLLVATIGTLAS